MEHTQETRTFTQRTEEILIEVDQLLQDLMEVQACEKANKGRVKDHTRTAVVRTSMAFNLLLEVKQDLAKAKQEFLSSAGG